MYNKTYFSRNAILVTQENKKIIFTNGIMTFTYDTARGLTELNSHKQQALSLTDISAEVKLGKDIINSRHLERDFFDCAEVEELSDGFGNGVKLSIHSTGMNGLIMLQNFYVYESYDYMLMDVIVMSHEEISSNYITPFAVEKMECSAGGDMRFIFTPFDNDDFIRYAALPLTEAVISYEVTAVYDNDTRNGFVTGAVTHDIWKTGIRVKHGYKDRLTGFTVFDGITSKETRDTLPHGHVYGKNITSSKILVGFFDDYRTGLEAYGEANAIITPPLPWDGGIPMGWNSWSAVAKAIDYDIYTSASDYMKENLQHNSFSVDEVLYINFDAGWNKLTEEQLIAAAKHVKDNGQRPGIYTTPFTFWGNGFDNTVPGTDGKYTWNDVLLKDENGNILPKYDGGYTIDPTHPGSYLRLVHEFERFKKWGYMFCKMDFLSHGTVEGVHYNKEITTGIAAYNYGMKQIVDILKDEIEKQEFFLCLSIAPLFPSQYAHSRRISCDIFGTINFAEYMLNSLTYGWWMNGSVYRFNDPDHIVVYNSYNHLDAILYNEGLTRYISSAISGTMMIDSDDFRIEMARNRCREILTNEEINTIAKSKKSFRPVEGNTGDRGCDCFVKYDEAEKAVYLALFNFSADEKKEMVVNLTRIGLEEDKEYIVYDLWTKKEEKIKDIIKVRLDVAEPKLYKIY